jgi:hypothetical protein
MSNRILEIKAVFFCSINIGVWVFSKEAKDSLVKKPDKKRPEANPLVYNLFNMGLYGFIEPASE